MRDRAAGRVAANPEAAWPASVTAIDAVDSMLRSLYLIRAGLVREISTADTAVLEDGGR
jgi:hypothetical protein